MLQVQLLDSVALRSRFRGEVILPGDAAYDDARKVWNGMIDKYPAVIVRPIDSDDVIAAVNLAREHDLLVSVRGGGHNVAGHATNDNGLVIDLRAMKKIAVDPVQRLAWVEGGATWGELDAATQAYGLATPGGVFSKTGIAGLTLGGGVGWLRNKYGLSCDNLVAADVVTADGRLLRVDATQHADLLWGLRGGGGNFGIVTSFAFQLHAVGPDVMMVFAFHPVETEGDAVRAVRWYRDYCRQAPDEVSSLAALGQVPPSEHFPQEMHGAPFILYAAVYAGPVDKGRQALQPLLDFGQPFLDLSGVLPFVEAQQMFDADYPDGLRYYWKSLNLTELTDEAISTIVRHARLQPSPYNTTDLWHIGGAIKRVSATESAFTGRQAAFIFNPEANWLEASDDDANIAWVRRAVSAMKQHSDGSHYLNFPGFQEEGDAMMRASFGSSYERLAALKQKFDPCNLFRLNQNVQPQENA